MDLSGPLCLPLASPEARLELVGGKGASLARMAAAGLPVPDGFQVTTLAYRRFVAANGLAARLLETAARAPADDPVALERAAAEIRGLFERGDLPAGLAAAIQAAFAQLEDGRAAVAVRSSATAEDLPELSFAGQQETFLNVHGETALLAAVRDCWASLWSARAIVYRLQMGVDQRVIAMGVVVQRLVPAEVAGVVFTANPTTGARDELLVSAAFGLGESVVSGRVTPDSFRLDKASLTPKAVRLGTKELAVVPSEGQGVSSRVVPKTQRAERTLPDRDLRRLGHLALEVERLYDGVPQDLEWALADGRIWLLQARPMTGLPAAPPRDVRWEPPTPGSTWIRRQVVENMPDPLSPLFEELYLQDGLEPTAEALVTNEFNISQEELGELVDRPMFATVNGFAYIRADAKLTWKSGLILLRSYLAALPALFRTAVPRWRDEALPAFQATIERWRSVDLVTASDDELIAGPRVLARAGADYWWRAALVIGVAKISDALLDWFLRTAARGRRFTSGRFLRGYPSGALEAEAELEAIAARIRADDELRALVAATPARQLPAALASHPRGRPLLAALDHHLTRFGHLVFSLDFAEPTQIDDPLSVLLNLKTRASRPAQDVRARHAALVAERDRLIRSTARSLDPVRRAIFLRLLRWALRFGPYREQALFFVGAAWPPLRRLALELGRRLVQAGTLDRPDDVFYLRSAELQTASRARLAGRAKPELARLARQRRALRAARQRLHPPAAVPPESGLRLGPIDLSGFETQRRNLDSGPILRGFAVSPGQVTAPASVIHSPAEFDQMEPGTILVCQTTTPAWTPLFAQARGLVTDIGSVTAHGSIVAREYGIPAVMGTGNATQRIASGQLLTVDGDSGTVTLVGGATAASGLAARAGP